MESSVNSFTLSKYERLSKKTELNLVFSESRSFVIFPFKFLFVPSNEQYTSILFTVPKRSFKKAVDRNAIKRQLKDIYRQNKIQKNVLVAVIYLSKEKLPFNLLKNKLILGLKRLSNDI